MKPLVLGLFVAVVLALSSLPARGQGWAEDASFGVAAVDTSDYPVLEVLVSAPAAWEGETEATFSIVEPGRRITPTVTPLGSTALDVVLAIDTSGSMADGGLAAAQEAARAFVAQLPPTARFAVVGFGAEPTVAVPLSSDREAVAAGIEGLVAGGETALYDAALAAAALADSSDSRSAVVVLSDGGDTVSAATLQRSSAAIAETFDLVHAIALSTTEADASVLSSLVGGGAVASAQDPAALTELYRDIASEIASQTALRWETTLEEDRAVTIEVAVGAFSERIVRPVDLDEVTVAGFLSAQVVPDPDPAPDSGGEAAGTIRTELVSVDTPSTTPAWVLPLGVFTIAAGIFVGVAVAMTPHARTRSLASDFRTRMPQARELGSAARRAVALAETLLRRDPERRTGLALRLERAGLDLAAAEFAAVLGASAAIAALFGFGVAGLYGVVLLPIALVLSGLAWLDNKGKKRSAAFVAQLDSTLQLISGSLRSGFGIMQALDTVANETEAPTSEEFTRVLGETRLGRELGDALEASARRVDSEDYYWVVSAIEISREVGGNLAEVLDNVSNTIRQRNTLRRQVRALSAEGRVSALILFLLPIVMFAWMRFSNADYIQLLFDRSSGRTALVIAIGLMAVGAAWMRKIIDVRF